MHLIISESVDLDLHHLHGRYVMQFDGYSKPKLIVTSQIDSANIHFYQLNILDESPVLRGPLVHLVPFEFFMP